MKMRKGKREGYVEGQTQTGKRNGRSESEKTGEGRGKRKVEIRNVFI